jgi:threonine/homoserine/homoserine lactone efflux protein
MWKAFVFGVIVSGTVGPIALLIFGTGARQGLATGALAALGAALADFLYALLAFLLGALVLPVLVEYRRGIDVACALLLIAFGAWMIIAQLRQGSAPQAASSGARVFLPVFLLTALNPMTLVIFAGFVPQLPVAGSPLVATGYALALGAGSVTVGAGFAAAGAALGKAMPGERGRRAVSIAAAAGILAFGILGLVRA